MRGFVLAAVYTGALALANAGNAETPVEALREGDMRKLNFAAEPVAASDVPFATEAGEEMTLADFEGQVVLVNFWATWCAPCREEMPMLEALSAEFGGDDFAVVTIATGRNSPQGIVAFFEEIGVETLPRHTDARQALARSMGVLGLPVTVILDREGREIARLQGEADWSSDSARAIIAALIADGA
jgi:thiol-disulfide isomerase/thioredoxin